MKTTTKKQSKNTAPAARTAGLRYHPAYGALGRNVDLGIGILMAHGQTGAFEILGPVSTINEGIEIAGHDFRSRLEALDHCGDPMCPDVYRIWARDYDGNYSVAFEVREEDAIL